MRIFYVSRSGAVMAALAAAGAAGVLAFPASPNATPASPPSCQIDVSRSGAAVQIKAIVSAKGQKSGSYRLIVGSSGGNSSRINQSGDYFVDNGSTVVGEVSLGGRGSFNAHLLVSADGQSVECSRRVSGAL